MARSLYTGKIEYPKEFNLDDILTCRCRNYFGNGNLDIRDYQDRKYRIDENTLAQVLKNQIKTLKVVYKYNLHYLELFEENLEEA